MDEVLILLCCCSVFIFVCSLSASAVIMIKPRGSGVVSNGGSGGGGLPGCSDPFYEYSSSCANGYSKTKCTDPRRACAKKQHVAVYGREYSKLFGPPGKLTSYQCKKSSYITKMNMFVDTVNDKRTAEPVKVVKGIDAMCFDPIYGIEVPLKVNVDGGIGQLSSGATAGGIVGGMFAEATIGNYWGDGNKNFEKSDPDSSYSGIKTVEIWHDTTNIYNIDYITYDNRVFRGGGTNRGKKERFVCPTGTRLVGFEISHGASKKIDSIRFVADSPLSYRGF